MTELNHDKDRRILIIDDNRAIHDDFRKILSSPTGDAAALEAAEAKLFGRPVNMGQQNRYEIDSAYQGQDGVRLVQEARAAGRPYEMAFVDVRMPPGMDGVETTRKMWELDPDLQVVLCTAYSDYSWDEMFEKLGRQDGLLILKKPFDTVEVLQLAHALTEKWWLHQLSRQKMEALEGRVAERTAELAKSNEALQLENAGRKKTEETLRESEERFSGAFEHAPIGVALVLPAGRWLKVNRALCELVGYSEADLLTRTFQDITHPEDLAADLENMRRLLAGEIQTYQMEKRYIHARGQLVTILLNVSLVRDGLGRPRYFISQIQDITARKQLEARLFQSQKMETVGKLAGGVAHEFNSILTAIIGQSELMLGDLPAGSPLCKNATEITKAAGRAAVLTRQLLAFGRKQFLQPKILDLNQLVAGMDNMIRQIIGNDVDTRIVPAPRLPAVKADAGQMEQVIMNLVINARDAMPNGGKLTLETATVSFDPESAGRYLELKPGDYVMLAITDSGTGMSEGVKARLFEPFFTTKGIGEGTGLGLSTCYGIIKQSGGHISVYSEPGRGTTFKIFLPQVEPEIKPPVRSQAAPDLPGGTETILLVEDDPALREMAATLLRRLGYTVVAAANGLEALNFKPGPGAGPVDLLFTDVVMPHMSGKELADRMRAMSPHTRILFTSAYTENAIMHQGVLDQGVALLPKPFTPSALAHKLREVLDRPARANNP